MLLSGGHVVYVITVREVVAATIACTALPSGRATSVEVGNRPRIANLVSLPVESFLPV